MSFGANGGRNGSHSRSNGLGRFITPDWAAKATAVPYAEFADPQSLNLYGYVRNVPTTRFDPDGHCIPVCMDVINWVANRVMDDIQKSGGTGGLKKDVGMGALKAGPQLAFNNLVRTPLAVLLPAPLVMPALAKMADPPGIRSTNQTQADMSFVTQTLATAVLPFAKGSGAAATTEELLQGAANRAAGTVGPGSGPVYGTSVHTEFANEIQALGSSSISSEVSYLNGQVVPYGTQGSIRVDAVKGPVGAPTCCYDLKTGNATLTPARTQQIQAHVPGGSNVPVKEIKPE